MCAMEDFQSTDQAVLDQSERTPPSRSTAGDREAKHEVVRGHEEVSGYGQLMSPWWP